MTKCMSGTSALDQQTGGTHYKNLPIQPVEFAITQMYDFCTASILKYVSRHRQKNGRQDIEKAIHFAELRAEVIQKHDLNRLLDANRSVRRVSGLTWVTDDGVTGGTDMDAYIRANGFTGDDARALLALDNMFHHGSKGTAHQLLLTELAVLLIEYDGRPNSMSCQAGLHEYATITPNRQVCADCGHEKDPRVAEQPPCPR